MKTWSSLLLVAAVVFGWDKNPDPDVAGYKFFYGPIEYTNAIDTGTNRTIAFASLPPGRTRFAVVGYNSNRLESDFSASIVYPFYFDIASTLWCASSPTGEWSKASAPVTFTVTNSSDAKYFQVRSAILNVR